MSYYTLDFLSIRDIWMLGTVLLSSLFLIDDLFVDFLALIKKQKAKKIQKADFNQMQILPEKKIAILIANWHEHEIIERVVSGNLKNINYTNYNFILGVYPNDIETLNAAKRLESKYPQVKVVVNSLNGPTSKGQMLNQMVQYLKMWNQNPQLVPFDMIVIQDSEDVIHKNSLKLMNKLSDKYNFIQIPVFSLNIPLNKLTAGIYIDEFVESHTKDLLVRDHYNAGLPSAGVGTAISWKTVEKLLVLQNGLFLNEKTLTEDYHLGLACHDIGTKMHFGCYYYEYLDPETNQTKIEYIATREYFPQKVRQSIRQKTRWSLGISLQGFEERKWKSSHGFEKYFLWRDRKGLVNAPLFTSAVLFTFYFVSSWYFTGRWPSLDYAPYNSIFAALMWANLIFSVFRIINRMSLVNTVYGHQIALFVPVRWVLSNFINTSSTYNAIFQWSNSKLKGNLPAWSKTHHMIPEQFGLEGLDFIEPEKTNADLPENKDINITI